jgi:hypothetical protein
MSLNLTLDLGGDVLEFAVSLPVLETIGNELGFEAALKKQLIDAEQLLAQALVIDMPSMVGRAGRSSCCMGRREAGIKLDYKLAYRNVTPKK